MLAVTHGAVAKSLTTLLHGGSYGKAAVGSFTAFALEGTQWKALLPTWTDAEYVGKSGATDV